jgi:hypothetical protein
MLHTFFPGSAVVSAAHASGEAEKGKYWIFCLQNAASSASPARRWRSRDAMEAKSMQHWETGRRQKRASHEILET